MLKLLVVFSLLGAGFSTPVELRPGDRYDILARGGRNNVDRKPMTRADIELSVSEIAAQLLTNPPPGSIASSTPYTELVKDPENEAKVVDHIKGLLSDIYTNSIIQDEQVGVEDGSGEYEIAELNNLDQNTSVIEDEESADEMIAEEDDQLMMENRPTILQVFTKLDQSQVQDKEQLLNIISDMQAEKDAAELMVEGVTESEFFKDIEVNTYAAVEPTTTTTTTTTTTESTTTTQTTTTTTESTTTTTEDPGLLGRVGIIVNNGFGGVINGLANAANSLTSGGLFGGAANSPLWIPLGRRKRSVSQIDLLSPASLKTNSRSKWNPSLNSGNSFRY